MTSDQTGREASTPRRADLRLSALVVIALALRLGWVLSLSSDPATLSKLPDQVGYLELGQNLRDGRGMSFVDPRFGDTVWAFRMPGYPIFIAACQGRIDVVRVLQALIDSASVLGVYGLSRRWLDRGTSLLAALLVAINPFLIYFCGLILSETLFAALMIWGMALLVVGRPRNPQLRKVHGILWWAGAMLLVLSILVRPSAILLPVAIGIAGAFVNRGIPQPYDRKWFPPVATLMLLMTFLVLLPWGWRNKQATGRWIWTTTNGGFTLYDGWNPDATGASDQRFVQAMPQLQSMDEVGRSRYLGERAWEFARQRPQDVIRLGFLKIARMWSPVPLSPEYGSDPKLLMVSLGYMIPLYVLLVAGLWAGQANLAAKMFLLIPALYFTMVHALSVGSLRYRVPSDVPIAIIAAMGTAALLSRIYAPACDTPMAKPQ